MKIKDGFVLREVAGKTVVIAVGEASKDFHGMIYLNDTGKLIWEQAGKGSSEDEIAEMMTQIYEVDIDQAREDVHQLIQEMTDAGVFES